MSKQFKAIVAMSLNRAIGKDNKLPWHLPEDLKWFKKLTTGNVIIMGRKTWESIGKPLPNRESIVVTQGAIPGIRTVRSLSEIDPAADGRDYYIIGGAQLFREGLRLCSDLYLTLVKRRVDGDVFLDSFEEQFRLQETILDNAEMSILHYRRVP
jgi:dihydrofolate reductase